MDESGGRIPVFSLDSSFSQDGQLLMNPRTLELDCAGQNHEDIEKEANAKLTSTQYFKSISQIPTSEQAFPQVSSHYNPNSNGTRDHFTPAMSENSLLTLEQLLSDHSPSRQEVQLQRSSSNTVSTYSLACDLKTNLVSSNVTANGSDLNPVSPSLSEILNQNSVDKYLHDTQSFNHFPGPKSPTIAELLSRACSPSGNGFDGQSTVVSFTNGHCPSETTGSKTLSLPHTNPSCTASTGNNCYHEENDQEYEGDKVDSPDSFLDKQNDSPPPFSCRDSSPGFEELIEKNSPRIRDDPHLMGDDARDEPIKQDPIDITEYVEVLTTYKCKFCQFNCSDTAIMLSHIQAAHNSEMRKSVLNDKPSQPQEQLPSDTSNKSRSQDEPALTQSNKSKFVKKKNSTESRQGPNHSPQEGNETAIEPPQQIPALKSPPPSLSRKVLKKRKTTKVKPILPKPGSQIGPPSILNQIGPPSVVGPPPSVFPPPSVHTPSNVTVKVEYEPPSPANEEPSKESQVFICGVCRAFFLAEEDCEDHVNSVHKSGPIQKQTEDGVVFGCNRPPCKRTFKNREACDFHISCHIGIRKRPAEGGEDYGKVSKAKKLRRIFMCAVDKCKASFQYWQNCAQHAWTEHKIDTGLLCCNHCNYKTVSKFNMKMHLETHNPNPPEKNHICKECSSGFSSKSALDTHIQNVHHPEIHTCPDCGETTGSLKQLERHTIVHQDERPFECAHCPYKAKRKSDLNLHERQQHNPEKLYKCELCPFKTSDQSHMQRHKAVHTNHRKYKCSYCPMTFVACANLKIHTGIKHPGLPVKMYKCGVCSFKSRAEEALGKHIQDTKHTTVSEPEPPRSQIVNGHTKAHSNYPHQNNAQNITQGSTTLSGSQLASCENNSIYVTNNGQYPLLLTNGDQVYVLSNVLNPKNGSIDVSCGVELHKKNGGTVDTEDKDDNECLGAKSVGVVLSTDSVIS